MRAPYKLIVSYSGSSGGAGGLLFVIDETDFIPRVGDEMFYNGRSHLVEEVHLDFADKHAVAIRVYKPRSAPG